MSVSPLFFKFIYFVNVKNKIAMFSKLFNNDDQSLMYKSRPEYSDDHVKLIIDFWHKYNKHFKVENSLDVVDVGCGTGQLTTKLISFSKSLIAIDTSESQIKQAKQLSDDDKFPNYLVGSCYEIPVPEASVDLITAAQCVHWFDMDKFYGEVDRCLRQNGVLAILTYGKGYFVTDGDVEMIKKLNKFVCDEFWFDDKYLGTCYGDKPRWAWNLLPGLPILYPSTGYRNDQLSIEFVTSLHRYSEYLRSTTMYLAWKKANPNHKDLVEITMERILFYLGHPKSGLDTEMLIKFPLCLIMCSKP